MVIPSQIQKYAYIALGVLILSLIGVIGFQKISLLSKDNTITSITDERNQLKKDLEQSKADLTRQMNVNQELILNSKKIDDIANKSDALYDAKVKSKKELDTKVSKLDSSINEVVKNESKDSENYKCLSIDYPDNVVKWMYNLE